MQRSDFLVIGSGIAGLSFALKAAQCGTVCIITKNEASNSNTSFAQGGIACVMGVDDNPELHVKDTLVAGAGLCNEEAVRTMVYEAQNCISALLSWGVSFSLSDSRLDLGLEGGHTRNRIVHAKDFTGREIENALLKAIKSSKNIKLLENHLAIDLIVNDDGSTGRHCSGAEVLDLQTGESRNFYASNTIICTGGAGQVYLHTTNPAIATGDGIAMACRAGAQISNMEFVQFHPTALYNPDGKVFLISEALRGAGAILKNSHGEAFMHQYHLLGSLAPRDIASRAIETEMKRTGADHVYLDATHIPANQLISLFPNIYENCLDSGIDITTDLIPVVPSAHFMCGGIVTDLNGRTCISSLYAFGEAACTGVHGANRLASNSLLEAMVFSNRAFNDITHRNIPKTTIPPTSIPLTTRNGARSSQSAAQPAPEELTRLKNEIRSVTSRYCGITRRTEELILASDKISKIETRAVTLFNNFHNSKEVIELYNLSLIAKLIITSAMKRKASIGAHFMENEMNKKYSVADSLSAA
jgi:L-aspartate oxidase